MNIFDISLIVYIDLFTGSIHSGLKVPPGEPESRHLYILCKYIVKALTGQKDSCSPSGDFNSAMDGQSGIKLAA